MIDYLSHNAIELIVIGVAFCFSKEKVVPGFLIAYVSIMTYTFGSNQEYIELIDKAGASWFHYNRELAFIYMYEGFVMTMLSAISFVILSKLRAVASIVIISQTSISLIMAVSVYAYAVELIDIPDWLLSAHYSTQSLFVILYCVIAWTCVYYSRKA